MRTRSSDHDPIEIELRELFEGAVSEARKNIDVDERHRQWIVSNGLRSVVESDRTRWNRLSAAFIPGGALLGAALAALALFALDADRPQKTESVGVASTEVHSPVTSESPVRPTRTTIATQQQQSVPSTARSELAAPNLPTDEALDSTSSKPSPGPIESTLPGGTKPTAPTTSTTQPSTTATSGTSPKSTGTVGPSTSTAPTTTAPTTTEPPTTTERPTTERPTTSEAPNTTDPAEEMVVTIGADGPQSKPILGVTLSTEDWMFERPDGKYLLARRCQQVTLIAPAGHVFLSDSDGTATATIDRQVCPGKSNPRFTRIDVVLYTDPDM